MYARQAPSRTSAGNRTQRRGNIVERIAEARAQRGDIVVPTAPKPPQPQEITPELPAEEEALPYVELRTELRDIIASDVQNSANETTEPNMTASTAALGSYKRAPWIICVAAALAVAAAVIWGYAPDSNTVWLSTRV